MTRAAGRRPPPGRLTPWRARAGRRRGVAPGDRRLNAADVDLLIGAEGEAAPAAGVDARLLQAQIVRIVIEDDAGGRPAPRAAPWPQ